MSLRLILFFLALAVSVQAQTTPDVCARILIGLGQDSVTWQATPCVGFGGYVVLGQENGTGNFLALDTTNDNGIIINNPNENTWNYQVGMLCNGVLTNISTIVSNQRPITPNLTSVSIVNGTPVVSWNPSPSPEVIGYQVYKEIPYGSNFFFPYPNNNSIVSGTSFTDLTATSLLARYSIIAVSPCNKSLLGIGEAEDGTTGPHTSMIVQGKVDTCNQTITLSWNAYENWEDGIQAYEIRLNRNGTGFVPVDTVPNMVTSYTYNNAQDNDVLVFQIRALEQNKINYAQSNNLSFNVVVNRPMDYLYITNLSVTLDNEIEINWEWDTDVDYSSGEMFNGIDTNNMNSRLALPVIGSAVNGFQDNNVEPYRNSYYYNIQTIDACNQKVSSGFSRTIYLEVEALEEFKNKISWTGNNLKYGTVQDYWVYKIINGGPQRIAILPNTDTSYIDVLDITNEHEAENCYFVIANIALNFPNGLKRFAQSQSNKGCAVQSSNIHLPNAVSPSGENTHFRPVIVFSRSIYNYSMNIYDRYGQLIFETNDQFKAWDGSKDGQPLKMGVYVYVIRFQAPNLEWIERKGTVMLVR